MLTAHRNIRDFERAHLLLLLSRSSVGVGGPSFKSSSYMIFLNLEQTYFVQSAIVLQSLFAQLCSRASKSLAGSNNSW